MRAQHHRFIDAVPTVYTRMHKTNNALGQKRRYICSTCTSMSHQNCFPLVEHDWCMEVGGGGYRRNEAKCKRKKDKSERTAIYRQIQMSGSTIFTLFLRALFQLFLLSRNPRDGAARFPGGSFRGFKARPKDHGIISAGGSFSFGGVAKGEAIWRGTQAVVNAKREKKRRRERELYATVAAQRVLERVCVKSGCTRHFCIVIAPALRLLRLASSLHCVKTG